MEELVLLLAREVQSSLKDFLVQLKVKLLSELAHHDEALVDIETCNRRLLYAAHDLVDRLMVLGLALLFDLLKQTGEEPKRLLGLVLFRHEPR